MSKLLLPEDNIPPLYSTEKTSAEEKIIHMKLFLRSSAWYIAEWDGEDLAFGFCVLNGDLQMAEWGYVSLAELDGFQNHSYLPPVHRWPEWEPVPFADIDLNTGEPFPGKTLLPTQQADTTKFCLSLAQGFTVHCPVCIVHEDEQTIIALEMLAEPEKVNANWASLMNGGSSHRILANTVKLRGMKQHVRLNKQLPDAEWKETWLIHKQATLDYVDPSLGYFYLIHFEKGIPPQFYAMLVKCIGVPTLPKWTKFLWQKGCEYGLIRANDRRNGIGYNAFIVRTTSDWEQIISNGLAAGDITF